MQHKFPFTSNDILFCIKNVTMVLLRITLQVVFRATRGGGYSGDIAVDEIQIKQGRCIDIM